MYKRHNEIHYEFTCKSQILREYIAMILITILVNEYNNSVRIIEDGAMEKKNLILITMDEVRADHITCYGNRNIETENIDLIAGDGVKFTTCIASSVLTPVSHASILSGLNPYSHGVRGPFDKFSSQTLPVILKNNGYKTGGFVGNSMLGKKIGFNNGFDYFDEPKVGDRFMWEEHSYKDPAHPDIRFPWGNWWIDRMLDWIEENIEEHFFVFGHFFHTHEGSENQLIKIGLLEGDGPHSEYGFYDAKIKLCDELFIGPILKFLKRNGIYNDTTLVITADHGTTLGERALPPIPWRKDIFYPQHTTMYEPDLKVPFIIKDRDLPKDVSIDDCIKHVDILPTLLGLLDVDFKGAKEGIDLYPLVEGNNFNGFKAYIEDLFLLRGLGALQAIRTKKYKYIRNQTTNEEELYNIEVDAQEKENLINNSSKEEQEFVKSWRKEIGLYYQRNRKSEVIDGAASC
jgi:arylsulfatase A-like enzyme